MSKTPSSWIVTQLGSRFGLLLRRRRAVLSVFVLLLLPVAMWAQSAELEPGSEQEILQLLNRERVSRGVPALVASEPLQQAARKHSERMAAIREIGHELPGEAELDQRLGHEIRGFDVSGENVAVAADATCAHSALMHSPGHRANILDPEYNSVGIGVVRRGGEIYVTQDFAHLVVQSSIDEVEQRVGSLLNQERLAAGVPRLRRVQAPELRRRACEMAAHDRLNPRAGWLDGVSDSIAFTAIDPARIGDSLRSLRQQPARAFSVGACYQSSSSYDNPVYWIIVVTYL